LLGYKHFKNISFKDFYALPAELQMQRGAGKHLYYRTKATSLALLLYD